MLTANVTPLLVMADNNRITTEEGRISFQLLDRVKQISIQSVSVILL